MVTMLSAKFGVEHPSQFQIYIPHISYEIMDKGVYLTVCGTIY